jgi:hypothetical protein
MMLTLTATFYLSAILSIHLLITITTGLGWPLPAAALWSSMRLRAEERYSPAAGL